MQALPTHAQAWLQQPLHPLPSACLAPLVRWAHASRAAVTSAVWRVRHTPAAQAAPLPRARALTVTSRPALRGAVDRSVAAPRLRNVTRAPRAQPLAVNDAQVELLLSDLAHLGSGSQRQLEAMLFDIPRALLGALADVRDAVQPFLAGGALLGELTGGGPLERLRAACCARCEGAAEAQACDGEREGEDEHACAAALALGTASCDEASRDVAPSGLESVLRRLEAVKDGSAGGSDAFWASLREHAPCSCTAAARASAWATDEPASDAGC